MNSNEIPLDVLLAARGYVLLLIQHISTNQVKCIIVSSFETHFGNKNNTVENAFNPLGVDLTH